MKPRLYSGQYGNTGSYSPTEDKRAGNTSSHRDATTSNRRAGNTTSHATTSNRTKGAALRLVCTGYRRAHWQVSPRATVTSHCRGAGEGEKWSSSESGAATGAPRGGAAGTEGPLAQTQPQGVAVAGTHSCRGSVPHGSKGGGEHWTTCQSNCYLPTPPGGLARRRRRGHRRHDPKSPGGGADVLR